MSDCSGQHIAPVLLAGGKSARMGRDKSFVPLAGRPMIEVVAGRIAAIFGEKPLLVADRPDRYSHLDLPVVVDVYRERGPLGGIHAALAAGSAPACFVFACDMPFLDAPLIAAMRRMADGHDAVAPRHGSRVEPLHAIYRASCLPLLESMLREGRGRLAEALARLRVRYVSERLVRACSPDLRVFTNVNTPAELGAIAALAPYNPEHPVSAVRAERTCP
ncbi:molybdenum cofactor guanylyltransferase [Solidesulfovibrio sp.]|uniref:molybdenum cofactor guanylyltransferase n=1 Tax=Solidesulfovibrio sp. TaxID=2910990 RepID=UPI00260494D6|nr:molybdenum cofactor guanylyltransferase [Solidesulfovibrio sp.]